MSKGSDHSAMQNRSDGSNMSTECLRFFLDTATISSNDDCLENMDEYCRIGADAFIVSILALFSIIIYLLLFRTMQTGKTADNQVSLMLNTIRTRMETEDNVRRLKVLQDAKKKAIGWLHELRNVSARSLKVKSRLSQNKANAASTVPKKTDNIESSDKEESELLDNFNAQQQTVLPKIIITSESAANDLCNLNTDPASRSPNIIEHGSPVYV